MPKVKIRKCDEGSAYAAAAHRQKPRHGGTGMFIETDIPVPPGVAEQVRAAAT